MLNYNTQIRVIDSVDPGKCLKMLKKLNKKLIAKFPTTIRGYSIVKMAHLDEFFELKASPVEGQSLQQKEKKRRKRKG